MTTRLDERHGYRIYREVAEERQRQHSKWGEQNHPSLDQVLLNREGGCSPERMAEHYEIPGEARGKFLCEEAFRKGEGTYAHIAIEELCEAIAEQDEAVMRGELLQLTAVLFAWIERIDRHATRAVECKTCGHGAPCPVHDEGDEAPI